ncbi:MAG: DUF4440 domain-containing protein [Bacteroidota bacterium]
MRSIYIGLLAFICISQATAQTFNGNKEDIQQIVNNAKAFSAYVMSSDYDGIWSSYTPDAKIFPNDMEITEGKTDIMNYWRLPEGVTTIHHKLMPEEITILGDTAYDYGTYEGTTRGKDGSENNWKGKYVVVWKRHDGNWKMYLDIWNSIKIK